MKNDTNNTFNCMQILLSNNTELHTNPLSVMNYNFAGSERIERVINPRFLSFGFNWVFRIKMGPKSRWLNVF